MKRRKGLFCIACCSCFCLSIFVVNNTFATPSSISISISGSPSVTLTSTAEGRFADSGDSTITITTNHAAGYTLTAKASKSTSLEGNNGGSIPSISTAVTPANYADSTYAASNNLNDTWGYKPSIYNSSANTNYLPSPGLGTAQSPVDTLAVTNNANDGSYTVSIGTRITTATAIDSYSNGFVFAVTGNPTPYAITYNKNTTDTVTNMPTNHTTSDSGAVGETVTIDSTVPVRDGYNFKGWCSTTTSDDTCSGTVYNPDGGGTDLTLTINQTSSTNAFTLYAMWKNSDPCLGLTGLYDLVACRSKGKQTATTLQAAITVPTSADRTQDTSNSGVYEYDPSVFGTASDASNDNKIYYYRGVLENSVGSYGSDGSAVTYPNYVKLGNTCWRIVRTTGSGGVKMIYNGLYGATTAGSCANTETNVQLSSTTYFNRGTPSTSTNNYGTKGFITYVGYNYNSNYGYNNTGQTSSTANSTLFNNGTASNIRTVVEDWYNSNLNNYTSILETSAGYCNDRTTYSGTTTSTKTTSNVPYKISSATVYFGAYLRNYVSGGKLSLTCPNDTGYDLLTTSNGLGKPTALLTADEVALAGSGVGASYSSNYHANSFLRSGSDFWLLSPYSRYSSGLVSEFSLLSVGDLNYNRVHITNGVRPAISLTSGTMATSGSGTATDPWIVNAP